MMKFNYILEFLLDSRVTLTFHLPMIKAKGCDDKNDNMNDNLCCILTVNELQTWAILNEDML